MRKRYRRILILNPLGANANYFGAGIDEEAAALEREGSRVQVSRPMQHRQLLSD